jgi:hypothetical protein
MSVLVFLAIPCAVILAFFHERQKAQERCDRIVLGMRAAEIQALFRREPDIDDGDMAIWYEVGGATYVDYQCFYEVGGAVHCYDGNDRRVTGKEFIPEMREIDWPSPREAMRGFAHHLRARAAYYRHHLLP